MRKPIGCSDALPAASSRCGPMRDGVIADYTLTEKMLKAFVRRVTGGPGRFLGQNVMVCVPSGVTEVEKRAVLQAVREVGARARTFNRRTAGGGDWGGSQRDRTDRLDGSRYRRGHDRHRRYQSGRRGGRGVPTDCRKRVRRGHRPFCSA